MNQGVLQWAASQGFLPHGYCFQWNSELLGVMVASDAIIAAAYYSIPLALLVFVRRRKDLRFNWMFVLFSGFIFLCGTTHVADILTIWSPQYWLQAGTKVATAAVSAVTALALWPLIPRALTLPSTAELEAMVRRLEHEVAERRAAEARLDELTHQLEDRVAERTRELEIETAERLRLQNADRAREAAEQANRAKTDFLSRMSHELRTPLNAVLGFSQLLQAPAQHGERGLDDEQRSWAGHIETAGLHLLSLVNDVLEIGRIEAGKFDVKHESVDLASALQDCETMLERAADERQIQLDLRADSATAMVMTDGRRLRQVLSNLLSNAIKYNRPGGTVTARMQVLEGNRLHIEVADTGVGLSAAQQSQLFQPFNRLGREADARVPGTGLGLAVVKQVVDALRGRIEVHSRPGEGTRFVVDVPV